MGTYIICLHTLLWYSSINQSLWYETFILFVYSCHLSLPLALCWLATSHSHLYWNEILETICRMPHAVFYSYFYLRTCLLPTYMHVCYLRTRLLTLLEYTCQVCNVVQRLLSESVYIHYWNIGNYMPKLYCGNSNSSHKMSIILWIIQLVPHVH